MKSDRPPAVRSRRWSGSAPKPVAGTRQTGEVTLGAYADEHLRRKRACLEAGSRWLICVERHLEEAVSFHGSRTPLRAIGVKAVEAYLAFLLRRDNGRGGVLSPATANHYLNSLSNLFRRAVADEIVAYNPVDRLLHRPPRCRGDTLWLEAHEVHDVLDFARTWRSPRPDLAMPFLYELISTLAYTGIRKSEALGLRVDDVDPTRRVVRIRPNEWRGLKTAEAERTVPLFSELHRILMPHLGERIRGRGCLLFPSPAHPEERPIRSLRRQLDHMPVPRRLCLASENAGAPALRLRSRILRHSYCAARLQTLDGGAPISPFTVARELGHGDLAMVLRIYGHLGDVRCRGREVSYSPPGPGGGAACGNEGVGRAFGP